MVNTKRTEVALAPASAYAVMEADPAAMAEALAENLGGEQLNIWQMEMIKVPAGGVTQWQLLDPMTGKTTAAESIEGIIVHTKSIRSFWQAKFSNQSGPPDCSSEDAVIGRGAYGVGSERHPSGVCRACPMAQFGSAAALWPDQPGSGQACKANRLLFIMREDSFLPAVIKAPPASLKRITRYMYALSNRGMPATSVITRFALVEERGGAAKHGEIEPTFVRRLSPEEHAKVKAYAEQLRPAIDGVLDLAVQVGDDEANSFSVNLDADLAREFASA